jgi:flagellar basal-body rod protein FlgG
MFRAIFTLTTRNPSGFQVGLGAYVSDIFQTGNQLDIAIQGDGFFKWANR